MGGFGPALLASLSALVCATLSWRSRRALSRLAPPQSRALLLDLVGTDVSPDALSEGARLGAIAELNQRLADVAFELDAWPATFGALTRISLATGSGLALIAFLTATRSETERPVTLAIHVALAAAAGIVGAGLVITVGRSAKLISRRIRVDWDVSSRDIGKALGTSLAAGAEDRSMRGNRFPG